MFLFLFPFRFPHFFYPSSPLFFRENKEQWRESDLFLLSGSFFSALWVFFLPFVSLFRFFSLFLFLFSSFFVFSLVFFSSYLSDLSTADFIFHQSFLTHSSRHEPQGHSLFSTSLSFSFFLSVVQKIFPLPICDGESLFFSQNPRIS